MSIGYAWEKLLNAVTGMAVSPKSINDRIAEAFVYNLIHIKPEEDLPVDLRPQLAEIRAALTATPAKGDEGSAQASADAMTDEAATDIARKIVTLYDGVCVARQGEEG